MIQRGYTELEEDTRNWLQTERTVTVGRSMFKAALLTFVPVLIALSYNVELALGYAVIHTLLNIGAEYAVHFHKEKVMNTIIKVYS